MVQEVSQAELLAKSGMADAQAKAALHQAPDAAHRTAGSWPSGSTVRRVMLLVIVLLIAGAWALTLLNK